MGADSLSPTIQEALSRNGIPTPTFTGNCTSKSGADKCTAKMCQKASVDYTFTYQNTSYTYHTYTKSCQNASTSAIGCTQVSRQTLNGSIGQYTKMFFVTGYYVLSPTGYLSNPLNRLLQTPICYWAEMSLSHVYPVISFLLNMISLAKLIYMRTVKKSQSSGKRMEFNLFLICLASLVVQFALMFYVDYGAFLVDAEYRVFMLNIVSDFGTMSEAWIGIIVSRKLRQHFTSWLFSWKTFSLSLIGYDPTTTDAYQRAYRAN
ncbi:unnamed protein product, partial [Mesorhabditis belari]|uniref:Serpentine receptor class gamma n=1 Tax=Mesorhabditis belari TaxID=2138241 RepID=A0AAF3F8X0_9BILA